MTGTFSSGDKWREITYSKKDKKNQTILVKYTVIIRIAFVIYYTVFETVVVYISLLTYTLVMKEGG